MRHRVFLANVLAMVLAGCSGSTPSAGDDTPQIDAAPPAPRSAAPSRRSVAPAAVVVAAAAVAACACRPSATDGPRVLRGDDLAARAWVIRRRNPARLATAVSETAPRIAPPR